MATYTNEIITTYINSYEFKYYASQFEYPTLKKILVRLSNEILADYAKLREIQTQAKIDTYRAMTDDRRSNERRGTRSGGNAEIEQITPIYGSKALATLQRRKRNFIDKFKKFSKYLDQVHLAVRRSMAYFLKDLSIGDEYFENLVKHRQILVEGMVHAGLSSILRADHTIPLDAHKAINLVIDLSLIRSGSTQGFSRVIKRFFPTANAMVIEFDEDDNHYLKSNLNAVLFKPHTIETIRYEAVNMARYMRVDDGKEPRTLGQAEDRIRSLAIALDKRLGGSITLDGQINEKKRRVLAASDVELEQFEAQSPPMSNSTSAVDVHEDFVASLIRTSDNNDDDDFVTGHSSPLTPSTIYSSAAVGSPSTDRPVTRTVPVPNKGKATPQPSNVTRSTLWPSDVTRSTLVPSNATNKSGYTSSRSSSVSSTGSVYETNNSRAGVFGNHTRGQGRAVDRSSSEQRRGRRMASPRRFLTTDELESNDVQPNSDVGHSEVKGNTFRF